jgi:hypothetical protein
MVPPAGTVVAGVNTRTGVTVAPDTLVPRVMDVKAVIAVATPPEVMEVKVIPMVPPIAPDATPADAVTSASVCTVMPVALPAFATPIVKPLSVMVDMVNIKQKKFMLREIMFFDYSTTTRLVFML